VLFGQKLDLAAVLGLAMIIGGIVIIHLFSASSTH
jgi:small multidrug resistance pump